MNGPGFESLQGQNSFLQNVQTGCPVKCGGGFFHRERGGGGGHKRRGG